MIEKYLIFIAIDICNLGPPKVIKCAIKNLRITPQNACKKRRNFKTMAEIDSSFFYLCCETTYVFWQHVLPLNLYNCVNSYLDTNPITNVIPAKNKHHQSVNIYSQEIEILMEQLKVNNMSKECNIPQTSYLGKCTSQNIAQFCQETL